MRGGGRGVHDIDATEARFGHRTISEVRANNYVMGEVCAMGGNNYVMGKFVQ